MRKFLGSILFRGKDTGI